MLHTIVLGLALQSVPISVSAEQRMLADLNATRARAGLPMLKLDSRLTQVARQHASDMALHNYFAHASLNGQSPFDRMKSYRISFSWAGENLAMSPDEPTAYQALLQSPEHRANIMQRHFSKVGIAAVQEPDGEMLFVQDFTD
ncbi:MAG TPA: CAP domain-containing protein [Candidatus Rubrimentiphilum sp.]|nr:CAP domain-containing protein [Candidatus Rubrimentiphilum sp.]